MRTCLSKNDTPTLLPNVKRMAFIPARGGSKGLPRKNILDLCGLPLIAYTIRAAVRCGGFDRVVVSTDDEEIAGISRRFGACVPGLRPKKFAEDTSPISIALKHTLEMLKENGEVFNVCTELFPTSPFRTPRMIRELLSLLDSGYQNVRTAQRFSVGAVRFHMACADTLHPRVLALPPATEHALFFLGLFKGYWLKPTRYVWGTYIHQIKDPAERVDIDTQDDFDLARYIIDNHLFDFEA
jgi:CMP-N-acetylneuraminic acid synthetase